MQKKSFIIVLLIFCLAAQAQNVNRQLPTLAGIWIFKIDGGEIVQRVNVVAEGNEFKGKVFGQEFTTTLNNNKFEFRQEDFQWSGLLQGENLSGEILNNGTITKWSARRAPSNTPTKTYDYSPQPFSYSRYFSSKDAPVLRLNRGDVVRTKTIDASGTDENSKNVSWGGNPLTGPFFIENAVPGDVLVIKLKKVQTNRSWAFSGRALMDNVLDASYIRDRKFDRIDNAWLIEKEKNIVRLEKPTDNLKNLSVPLEPFLGCIGVAPPDGASLRSRDSGVFGGNMECRYVREGATIYLPVFQDGAYLFLGDGHANQGDGELAGDALETSMDVEFSVEVLESQSNRTPRVENEDSLISIGIAGSLDNATRTATSDLARWLEADYKLSSPETAMILGFANKYEIADLVPPYLTVLARIQKKMLMPIVKK